MEYAKLEPFGEERADLRAGIVAATIANAHRRKGSKPFKPSDFMPAFGPQEAQSVEQQLGLVEMLNVAFGGRDLRKQGGSGP